MASILRRRGIQWSYGWDQLTTGFRSPSSSRLAGPILKRSNPKFSRVNISEAPRHLLDRQYSTDGSVANGIATDSSTGRKFPLLDVQQTRVEMRDSSPLSCKDSYASTGNQTDGIGYTNHVGLNRVGGGSSLGRDETGHLPCTRKELRHLKGGSLGPCSKSGLRGRRGFMSLDQGLNVLKDAVDGKSESFIDNCNAMEKLLLDLRDKVEKVGLGNMVDKGSACSNCRRKD